jgi:hypothetical protein
MYRIAPKKSAEDEDAMPLFPSMTGENMLVNNLSDPTQEPTHHNIH